MQFRTKDVLGDYACTIKRPSVETKVKELKFAFVVKGELQHHGNSVLIALFGIPSMWGSERHVQAEIFSNKRLFDPRQTKAMIEANTKI